MKNKIIISICLFSIALLVLILQWFIPIDFKDNTYLKVEKGDSLHIVINKLKNKNINIPEFPLKLYYKLFPKQINRGDYLFKKDINIIKFSKKLSSGFVKGIKITIPEGFTYKKIANRLSLKNIVNKTNFINLYDNKKFIDDLDINSNNLEGYLFPDTYYFDTESSEKDIVIKMYTQLKEMIKKNNLLEKIKNSNYSFNEILTIASLVEWEAKMDKERPIIAQVFIKRLQINKPLESCATIEYALGEHKEKLSNQDLEIKSPYNTYKNYGLPPSPINNPGIESIKAVLNPANTDYLYFVSKNDGTHKFTKNHNQHIKAKRKYKNE